MVDLAKPAVDVGIVVADLEGALRFYRDTLGLAFERDIHVANVGHLAFVRAGDAHLKLVQPETPPKTGVGGGLGGGVTGLRYVTLHVTGLAAIIDRCRDAGYRVSMRPRDVGGVVVAAIDDGEGNWIELAERIDR
jgi:catechol 2,3-dioxygenase-like lactoylglutathione lyase family enzyme